MILHTSASVGSATAVVVQDHSWWLLGRRVLVAQDGVYGDKGRSRRLNNHLVYSRVDFGPEHSEGVNYLFRVDALPESPLNIVRNDYGDYFERICDTLRVDQVSSGLIQLTVFRLDDDQPSHMLEARWRTSCGPNDQNSPNDHSFGHTFFLNSDEVQLIGDATGPVRLIVHWHGTNSLDTLSIRVSSEDSNSLYIGIEIEDDVLKSAGTLRL